MSYTNDEEMIGRLLQQAHRPVSPPPGVREQIRERLIAEIECYSEDSSELWTRPRLMIPILASIASGLIAYGYWISMTLV
jgi:hypothetical protein